MVAEGDAYGIRVSKLIEGLCSHIVSGLGTAGITSLRQTTFNFDALCREVQSLILAEAKSAAARKPLKPGQKAERYDFAAVFELFDEDGGGSISLEEFRKMLSRLNLIDALPVEKVPDLLKAFDPQRKGVVTLPDFMAFALDKKYGYIHDDDEFSDGDFDDEEDDLPSSSAAPTVITQNAQADFILWNIWKNAMKKETKDPERIIGELEVSCTEVELETAQGVVSDRDLWFILSELNLKENISKQQYEDGIAFYAVDPKKKFSEGIDFESLCRGVVRMGRAYNAQIQEKQKSDTELYLRLKASLQTELAAMIENDGTKPRYV